MEMNIFRNLIQDPGVLDRLSKGKADFLLCTKSGSRVLLLSQSSADMQVVHFTKFRIPYALHLGCFYFYSNWVQYLDLFDRL